MIKGFGLTDKGKIRNNNEDFLLIDEDKSLYLLADGMGGHKGGEVASRTACKLFDEFFKVDVKNIEAHLIEVFKKVNENIFKDGGKKEELKGMGTTFIACYIRENFAHICHVGDVRIYLFRNDNLTRLTEDHSLVYQLLKEGHITEEEAKSHPLRSRLTKAIGPFPEIMPDYNKRELKNKDIVLLCSDGLWNMLKDEEIVRILKKDADIKTKTHELIDKANEAGGEDNIAVVLVELF